MRHVVLLMLDGLRADHAMSLDLPGIGKVRRAGVTLANQRSIFPSATRASSASVSTGAFPARHGLHGNQMALENADGFTVHDSGKPEFYGTLHRHRGRRLLVPTVAERVASFGGSVVFSNVSPGAAFGQDPDGYGSVYHRAASFAPGLRPADDPLEIDLSLEGDARMAERFVSEVLRERRPTSAVMWLGNPDDAQHDNPLGSPAAIAAIRASDAIVGKVADAVEQLDPNGDEVLFMVGSDHGHETIRGYIPVEAEIIAAGFKAGIDDTSLVMASQGTGFLVYATDGAKSRIDELADWLATREWCGKVIRESALDSIGQARGAGLRLAVGMRSDDEANGFGVPGSTFVAARHETSGRTLGNGSHGGFGRYESNPFLAVRGAGFPAGLVVDARTSLVDIAPTALAHLGLATEGLDGTPLQERFPADAGQRPAA